MESVIIHPRNKEQLAAIKAFAKALKIDFETKEEEASLLIQELKEAVNDVNLIKAGKKKVDLSKICSMIYKIITIPPFDRQAKRLVKKYPSLKTDLTELILKLQKDPEYGTPLGNHCYKIRFAIYSLSILF